MSRRATIVAAAGALLLWPARAHAHLIRKHSTLSDKQKTTHLQKYLAGKLTDYVYIKKIAKSQEEHVKQAEEKILVLDGVSYGTDVPRFVDALQPTTYEKITLEYILQKSHEPVITSKITPSKLLERYWNQYGK